MSFCKECGSALLDGAQFCSKCGTSVIKSGTADAGAVNVKRANPAPTSRPATNKSVMQPDIAAQSVSSPSLSQDAVADSGRRKKRILKAFAVAAALLVVAVSALLIAFRYQAVKEEQFIRTSATQMAARCYAIAKDEVDLIETAREYYNAYFFENLIHNKIATFENFQSDNDAQISRLADAVVYLYIDDEPKITSKTRLIRGEEDSPDIPPYNILDKGKYLMMSKATKDELCAILEAEKTLIESLPIDLQTLVSADSTYSYIDDCEDKLDAFNSAYNALQNLLAEAA